MEPILLRIIPYEMLFNISKNGYRTLTSPSSSMVISKKHFVPGELKPFASFAFPLLPVLEPPELAYLHAHEHNIVAKDTPPPLIFLIS